MPCRRLSQDRQQSALDVDWLHTIIWASGAIAAVALVVGLMLSGCVC